MKKWILLMLSLALVLTGCVDQKADPPMDKHPMAGPIFVKEPKDAEEVQFVEHVDGDTSKFRVNGKVETVRYLLIDTPETKHPELGEQPLGKEVHPKDAGERKPDHLGV